MMPSSSYPIQEPPRPSFWVEPDALKSVAGGSLFYPAAGPDMEPMLNAFAPSIQRFIFNDLHPGYRVGGGRDHLEGFHRLPSGKRIDRVSDAPVETRHDESGRSYRYLEPSLHCAAYDLQGVRVEVMRRRGFGQYALLEQPAGSISIFVHRCDSPGESGSNMWFLANKKMRHEPLGNLWNKLAIRLRPQALVVSDGSLTNFAWLKVEEDSAEKAYKRRSVSEPKFYKGSAWRCVGFMADRSKTLLWHVTKAVEGEGTI